MNIWDFSNPTSPLISVGGIPHEPAIKENLLRFHPDILFVLSVISNGLTLTIATELIAGTQRQKL